MPLNKEMRLSYDRTERPQSKHAVDSIIVYPNSRGILRLGLGFAPDERHPRFQVAVTAVDKDLVSWEPETLYQEDRHHVLVHVYNRNDSPAYAVLSTRT
jgi:hypothetical protein